MEARPFIDTLITEIDALPDFPAPTPHDQAGQNGAAYHRLSYNESAYGPSPTVIEAIQRNAAYVGLYPEMRDDRLRDKLAATYGRGLDPENFFTGCSGYESLELIARAFFRPGDEIIAMQPTFSVYGRIALLHGATLKNVPLLEADFTPDIDALLAAITPQTRAIMLCNPNNPTGTIMTQAQMDQLMTRLPSHVLVISDEVYFHYVTDALFPDTMRYVLEEKNIVLIHTFSKGYGLAGMRMGYGIAPHKIAGYIRKFYRGFHLNTLQLAAGLAAIDDEAHLQKNIDAAVQGREYLYEHCDRMDLPYWTSQTNFVLINLPRPAKHVADRMKQHGVLVRALGSQYPTYLRISIGTPQANEACVKALEAALQEVISLT